MGQHLSLKIHLNSFLERHGLGVTQVAIRLWLAIPVFADCSAFIPLTQGGEHYLQLWYRKFDATRPFHLAQGQQKLFSIREQGVAVLLGKGGEQTANGLLTLLACLDLLLADGFVLFDAGGKVFEISLCLQAGDTLRRGLKVEAQRPLNSDFMVAKVLVVKNFAHH